MKITIIGTGFVGVVSAAVYASFGHKVVGLDIDQAKVDSLTQGIVPFFEPQLEDLLKEQLETGNLTFTVDYETAITDSDIIIIAVGTPSAADGQADLRYVFAAGEAMAPYLTSGAIVAIKSTVPPGTLPALTAKMQAQTKTPFVTASLPEFLREGTAVQDTLKPDRIVIGATDPAAIETLKTLHAPLAAPILVVSPESAQMGKYTANAYLATRITFINQIADLCQKNGASIDEVIDIIGHDNRIGKHYWYPGFGYGGSCFPKDVDELAAYSRSVDEEHNLLNKVSTLNEERIPRLLEQYQKHIGDWNGKKIAVLGLSFKPNTNDMREAPSTKIIPSLLAAGATITAYDPQATAVAESIFPAADGLQYADTVADAIVDADCIFALIEWPEITGFDFPKVDADNAQKQVFFIDARNQFKPEVMRSLGYQYFGVGIK